jgi:hypothetical protein
MKRVRFAKSRTRFSCHFDSHPASGKVIAAFYAVTTFINPNLLPL